jgi:hypothetical protein
MTARTAANPPAMRANVRPYRRDELGSNVKAAANESIHGK